MRLDIRNLTKYYGTIHALDGLTLQLEPGIYGILGPNGAGKSTLMSILTLNLKRSGGELLCDGQDILKMGRAYRSLVGYMPQEQICYPQFSGEEFLYYMARLKGLPVHAPETKECIAALLKELHLYEVRRRRIGTYSGGMKRRIVLAQALLGDPQLLILDEPTAGLDPKERISIRNLIARLAGDRIVLLATHIAGDIECIADHVILMKQGRVIKSESPFSLMESVRPFVGEIFCERMELEALQERFPVSSCVQTSAGLCLHTISQEKAAKPAEEVSLDDVYLYYFESENQTSSSMTCISR